MFPELKFRDTDDASRREICFQHEFILGQISLLQRVHADLERDAIGLEPGNQRPIFGIGLWIARAVEQEIAALDLLLSYLK